MPELLMILAWCWWQTIASSWGKLCWPGGGQLRVLAGISAGAPAWGQVGEWGSAVTGLEKHGGAPFSQDLVRRDVGEEQAEDEMVVGEGWWAIRGILIFWAQQWILGIIPFLFREQESNSLTLVGSQPFCWAWRPAASSYPLTLRAKHVMNKTFTYVARINIK